MLAFEMPRADAVDGMPRWIRQAAGGPEAPLLAAQRLAGAVSASLLHRDRHDGTVTVAAGTEGETTRVSPDVAAALTAAAAFVAPAAQPLWIEAPRGTGATLITRLANRGTGTLFLALALDDATVVARARVGKLVPDLATLLGCWLDQETRARELDQQRAAAMATLDMNEVGVIAVRADHSVAFTNAVGAAILADGDALLMRRGEVRPARYGDVAAFQAALDAVIDSPRATRAERRRAFVMLLTPDRDRTPVVVAIAPAGKARATGDDEPAAILHLLPADTGGRSATDVLCQLHGLSPVETRLVAHLCAGLTVSEAAGEMRIKVETARAYLKQVFGKTGTHRQTELTLLISRYARALPGAFDFRPA